MLRAAVSEQSEYKLSVFPYRYRVNRNIPILIPTISEKSPSRTMRTPISAAYIVNPQRLYEQE